MKQIVVILVLLGTIVGAALWIHRTQIQPAVPFNVTVRTKIGDVRRGTGGNDAAPLKDGDQLREGNRIFTGAGSFVELSGLEGETFRLKADSEVLINRIAAEGVRFELKQGEIEASVTQYRKDRTLEVGVTGNPVVVESKSGQFRVAANGERVLDVAADEGAVGIVYPDGRHEQLQVGERRIFAENGEELLRGPIPRSVLLKVDWPEKTVQTEKSLEVTGTVTPGSRLRVDGKVVRPDRDGRFKTIVPLQEGKNQIDVEAKGLGDPARSQSPEVFVDTRPPTFSTQTDEIWK